MMLALMVFLPMTAALVCYPLCGRSEKNLVHPRPRGDAAVFAMALSLLLDAELCPRRSGASAARVCDSRPAACAR